MGISIMIMRTHDKLTQSLLRMYNERINTGRRIWRSVPTRDTQVNLLSDVSTNVCIHAVHDVKIVLSNLLLVQLQHQRWYPLQVHIVVCWPHDDVRRVIPHVETTAVTRRLATTHILLAHQELKRIEEEMLQEEDLGVDLTHLPMFGDVFVKRFRNIEASHPRQLFVNRSHEVLLVGWKHPSQSRAEICSRMIHRKLPFLRKS